jgi:glutaredoxin 3|tara:strand:- start:879 stop:1151 length:273 start_codon:yes stop_codon:yes gene_type:complete
MSKQQTVVYSKPSCPSCVKAKSLLDKLKIEYTVREVGTDITREQLLEEFEVNGMPQPRSVPQVILNGKYIGGYEALSSYVEENGIEGTQQ